MSTSKVIFTYKRKRLSSQSRVGNADVCPDFPSDVQDGKRQAALNESSEKDQMVQRSDACNSTEMQHRSTESSEVKNCKLSGKVVSTEATLQETTNSSCMHLDPTCPLIDGSIQGGLVLKVKEEPNSLSKHKTTSTTGKSKCKVTTAQPPVLTYSRRLKRKDGAGSSAITVELPVKGAVDVGESEDVCVRTTSRDAALNVLQAVEKSATLNVASLATNNVVNGNKMGQSREKMPSEESRDSCLFTKPSSEIPALKPTVEKRCSQDDFRVDTSSGTKQSVSALTSSDAMETTTLPDNIVLKSSVDENSSCDDICKTDAQHVTNQCRTSSGDSQLTSSEFSDVKPSEEKAIQQTASSALDISCTPPSGALLIDCNVIPKPELQEKESDTVQHSSAIAENHGKATKESHLKGKGLALSDDTARQIVESPSTDVVRLGTDLHSPLVSEKKPGTKCLQLFSEEPQNGHFAAASSHLEPGLRPQQNLVQLFSEKRQDGQFTPATTNLGTSSRRPQQNTTNSYDYNMGQFEQAPRKAPATIGLSPAMDPIYEGQTSRHNSGMHRFLYHNVGIQNPAFHSFPDQPLLGSCNTRGTAVRGPTLWSEEELDSLWIGVRRYGFGNWHAMLLDPKLRFAPWRVARDLAAQWNCEESSFLTAQHRPQASGPCVSREIFSAETRLLTSQHMPEARGPRVPRDFLSTGTGLSLGELHAGRDGNYFQTNGQNNLSHVQITLASTQFGNYNSTSFNTTHTSVTTGGDGTGMSMGMNPNNNLPHWLQEPTAPNARFVEPPHPQLSTIPQTGGSHLVRPYSNSFSKSTRGRNRNNNNSPGPTNGRQRMTEPVIIIDSDDSSEETVSDDRFMRN